jgi:sugar O-acyltransferase (sialic acid O-acetyltransferase NeuD family)
METIAKKKRLVLFGDSLFAEVAYECFTHDSPYEVVGFAVEEAYITKTSLLGLPVVAIEKLAEVFPAVDHDVYVAIVNTQQNRLRKRLMEGALSKGYGLASYISSKADIWHNVTLGSHCFILEQNVVQPFVQIGDNVVLWSGNHVGHHSRIASHAFISSHVVISGGCSIGEYCFIGVNSALADRITIGDDCFINMATIVTRNLEANKMYRGQPAKPYRDDTRSFFNILL